MSDRPNFYLLLDLDPGLRDWAAIERRIQETCDRWSRDRTQGHPKARARAERSLAWLPEIKSCLADPTCREREAREAEALLAEQKRAQEADLDDLIGLILSGGGVCDGERLDALAQKYGGTFSREEIADRLRRAGVEIAGEDGGTGSGRDEEERLDRHTGREIRRNLDVLGLPDLYAFLGLSSAATAPALREAAAKIYRENLRDGRHDATATAQNELTARCREIFASEETKAAYDRHVAVEPMERMADRIELAGSDGLLTREDSPL